MKKKTIIYLSEKKETLLKGLMLEDHMEDETYSSYISGLIAQEQKRRDVEKARKPQGRPRKEDGEQVEPKDEPRNIPHPEQVMNAGVMLTQSEYDMYMAYRGGEGSIS